MGLFDFLHRPSEKNTQEAIKEVKKNADNDVNL